MTVLGVHIGLIRIILVHADAPVVGINDCYDLLCVDCCCNLCVHIDLECAPMVERKNLTGEELVIEFNHTRSRHQGLISLAAPVLAISEMGLVQRLYRLRKAGWDIDFVDDTRRNDG